MSAFKRRKINLRCITTFAAGVILGSLSARLLSEAPEDISDDDSPKTEISFHDQDEDFHQKEDEVAQELAKKVRVLCWIMTGPENHQKKAKHVKATWGKRCNILLFMSSVYDPSLPTVALPVKEGRDNLWGKTKEAFEFVYENYLDQVEWFLKADDDTYVIVENLRYMLSPYSPASSLYFGCRFKPFVKQGWMTGGAGYVLSRTSLRLLVEEGLKNPKKCRADSGGAEDVEMGKCLENIGVSPMDSRDSLGRGRFFQLTPKNHIIPNLIEKETWYWNYTYYEAKKGLNCCSDTAVSFHYITPNMMYVLEYLIYHLRPYGISPRFVKEKKKMDSNEEDHVTSSALF